MLLVEIIDHHILVALHHLSLQICEGVVIVFNGGGLDDFLFGDDEFTLATIEVQNALESALFGFERVQPLFAFALMPGLMK